MIGECVRTLHDSGSICWQVGNYVNNGEIIPLDIALYPIFAGLGLHLRNRSVWHFEHGLHASKRFSGRYEVILWFTKSDRYTFNLDDVRVPQKYPNKKHFKGPSSRCAIPVKIILIDVGADVGPEIVVENEEILEPVQEA